ncbi:MAG: fasciclin domain-containing protein, partial [Bacteroidota bacterium]
LPVAIRFDVDGSDVQINQTANLIEMDEEYLDGVIHVSDYVVEPPDLIETLELNGNFETLLEAIELADLTDDLRSRSNITFFAPTDDAFDGFFSTEVGVNDLEDYTQNELSKILRYHILEDIHTASVLRNLSFPDVFSTLLNNQDVFISSSTGFVFVNDSINVSLLDVHSLNATIHVVDDVLEFE